MTIDDLIAKAQINDLFADYCHRYDDGDHDAWADLFASDATMYVGRQALAGRDSIREWAVAARAAAPQQARHHVSNIAVELHGRDLATVVADYLVVGADRQILAVGRYDDRLVATEDGWRLAEHRVSFLRAG